MAKIFALLAEPTLQTLYMVGLSSLFAILLGLPLGIALALTEKGGLCENRVAGKALDTFVNVFRSFPFIILMIILFPLSRLIVGTTIGTTAAIVPLSISAAPFVGRVVQSALKEVDRGVIEAAQAMGADVKTIVLKVMIPEALPSLAAGATLTVALYFYAKESSDTGVVFAIAAILLLLTMLINLIADLVGRYFRRKQQ